LEGRGEGELYGPKEVVVPCISPSSGKEKRGKVALKRKKRKKRV